MTLIKEFLSASLRSRLLSSCCVALSLLVLSTSVQADLTVRVGDSSAPWLGYMNWTHEYPVPNPAWNGASPWGVADLTAVFDDGAQNVTLGPNTIADPAEYWYVPGTNPLLGAKIMEANLYIEETGPLAGENVIFEGNVASFGLSQDYQARAFIKDFAPDYSSNVSQYYDITTAGAFSLSMLTIPDPTRHVQYGLQVIGRNIWPEDLAGLAAAGNLVVGTVPEPGTLVLFGLGMIGLIYLRRRR